MNTVTSADSSSYAADTNEKTEKGPCLAMTYGVIGAERVNEGVNQEITTSRLVTPNNTPPKIDTHIQTMLFVSQFTEAIRH